MARVTSSRNRSKRSTKKPISSDKGRQARARVSQARVTSASNGKASGSASSRVTQGRGGASKPAGRPALPPAKAPRAALPPAKAPRAALPPAKPAAKPNGRQPRAITNGNSTAMRRLRAKAVQARRQAQGKSTVASRNPGITPDSARGQRIRQMANSQRVIGDGGRVRAAQAQGAKNVAQAQARRGAKAASKAMESKLRQAAAKRMASGGLKAGVKAAVFMEGLTSRNTGDGTLTAAAKRGDLKKTYAQDEAKTRAKNAERRKADAAKPASKSFEDAFRDARLAKVKTFTWRGKKYTTEMK